MKKLSLTLFTVTLLVSTVNAAILFDDTFTVAGGGDINFEYNAAGRQFGTAVPLSYNQPEVGFTVTNVGQNAGKANVITGPGQVRYLNLNHNFIESGNFSVEYELTRLNNPNSPYWGSMAIGTDGVYQYPHQGANGLEIRLWNHGYMWVSLNGERILDMQYPELTVSSNRTLKLKLIVSQPDFRGSGDAHIAMFINDKAYPMRIAAGTNIYTITNPGGFTNNYLNFIVAETDANIDNLKVMTLPGNTIATKLFTGDADSGITNSKFYTHSVNLADTADVIINGQTFIGAGTNSMSGSNWELRTANAQPLGNLPIHENYGIYPNVTPASRDILTNVLYSTSYINGGALTLTGLTPGQQYILTLYSMAFDAEGGRRSYIATSDGSAITDIDQDEFGQFSGQLLTCNYIANDNGIFSISTTPITESWGFYAFSNELSPPPSPENFSASQAAYNDKIVLTWDEQQGVSSYSVYRAVTNDSLSASLLDSTISNSYTDSAISLGQYYYYWVKASNSAGTSDFSNSALGFSKSLPPEMPTNIQPVDFNLVTSPLVFTATAFYDPSGFLFTASEWQISDQSDFSDVIWKSGESITENHLTAPASAGVEGTNYWRVRYKNNRKTWSHWSSQTSFILIKTTNTSDKVFADSFNCPGSGDVNNQYAVPGRQTGNSSPLTYRTQGTTESGNSTSNPGQLTLGSNSGCSINESFIKSLNFKIAFEVEPHKFDGTADSFSFCFGKISQDSLAPDSESGAGLVFPANGNFHSFAGETLLNGGSVIPTDKKMDVNVSASVIDFDYGTAVYTVFVNGIPMIQNANYGYIDGEGYGNNYITMFSENNVSSNSTIVDNISVKEIYNAVTVTNWTSDSDSLVDSSKVYTHAVNLNGNDVEINGVTFVGAGALGSSNLPNSSAYCASNSLWQIMSSAGSVNFFDGGEGSAVNISGSSKTLAKDFCWWGSSKAGGNSTAIKLSGLAPFSSNRMTIYTYAFEDSGRESYFSGSAGNIITNVSQNTYGIGNGLILQYNYVASANGTFTLVALPATDLSFHIAAFSSEETAQAVPKLNIDKYVYFGEVPVGNSKTMPLEVRNSGGGNVSGTITGISSAFILTNSYYATALTSDIINVEFTPINDMNYTNVITLSGSGGSAEVKLIGSGIPEPIGIFIIYNLLFIIYYRRKYL
ncbi:MAG: hypothetical protein DRI44_08405 [Chlamydiae bacterium]|nr:MAG: hypothetical protein DRI44_08405 [Chlamydiota bacterium]